MRWYLSLASLLASGSGALAALAPRTSISAGTCRVCPESSYGNTGTSYVNADNGDLMCPMVSSDLESITCEYDGGSGALVAGSNTACPTAPATTTVVVCNPLFGDFTLQESYYQSYFQIDQQVGVLFCNYGLPGTCSFYVATGAAAADNLGCDAALACPSGGTSGTAAKRRRVDSKIAPRRKKRAPQAVQPLTRFGLKRDRPVKGGRGRVLAD